MSKIPTSYFGSKVLNDKQVKYKLTITSTSASILTKASLGQTTSTKFFHRVLGESACYDACEGYCQTLLFEEFTLALFDPSSNTRVLSGVEVRSQSWWSCKNRSAAAIMLCFRLWKNDLTTIRSSYFTVNYRYNVIRYNVIHGYYVILSVVPPSSI